MVRKMTLTAGIRRLSWSVTAPPPEPIKPRPDGTYYGLGWDSVIVQGKAVGYFKDGSSQGMRTFMKRLSNGVNWALLYNASMEFDPQDMQLTAGTVHEVRKLSEGTANIPTTTSSPTTRDRVSVTSLDPDPAATTTTSSCSIRPRRVPRTRSRTCWTCRTAPRAEHPSNSRARVRARVFHFAQPSSPEISSVS
jgi:hypothetical protein